MNDAKLEFHPNIKQHHLLQTISFSDQGSSWHCLHYVGLQVLRSRLAHRDLSKKGAIEQAQLGRASLAPCFYNFNTAPVRLERHVVYKRSKTIPAWWLTSNLRNTILAIECQINDQKSRALLTQQTWIALGILGEQIDWRSCPNVFRKASETTTLHL